MWNAHHLNKDDGNYTQVRAHLFYYIEVTSLEIISFIQIENGVMQVG